MSSLGADTNLALLLTLVENIRTRQRHELRRVDALEERVRRLEAEAGNAEHAYMDAEDQALRKWQSELQGYLSAKRG